jgi:PTS system nitrogen regulatory IIA component
MMNGETMDLDQLAVYLQRDKREVSKLASRGYLPGRRVSGEWRFAKAEINHWIETQLPEYSEQQLLALEEREIPGADSDVLITDLLSEATMAVPLLASTRASVLQQLVRLAEESWRISDPQAILEAIRQREEMASTAFASGVAIPHPRRPLPNALSEPVIAYGRTTSALPFGAPQGGLTDMYFLVCCRDEGTHLRVLARLARLLLRPGFVDELREAQTTAATWQLIEAAERELGPG